MPARTRSRSHPSAASSSDSVEIRLPWWSVALPAVAFVVLFLLMADPGQAHAATDDPTVGRILEHIHLTLGR
ncbi:hypothetical protein [Streptomyces scopuliridis]|uniref:Uncharacterized protein n=1 Tax=Streptomyces scopuliridis RB72 TaxID=1440053 RepID=A0A2T7T8F6_9ACTN|nr:hypothetical protein [Streptomyces scopuliridis]PVE11439.1 hypothetical protein Y717_04270 [Streptomyces scopuliridis RB72]